MNLERAYELAKRYGWPHFFVPLFLLILIDYVHVLLHFVTIGLLAYVCCQSLGFAFGAFIGLAVKLSAMRTTAKEGEEHAASMWTDFLNYRLATVIPTIAWGRKFLDWLLTENEPAKPEPEVAPAAE